MNPYLFITGGQSLMLTNEANIRAGLEEAYPGCKVLHAARRGTLIERDWQIGCDDFENAVKIYRDALAAGLYTPGALLWYQGQSNALTKYAATATAWRAMTREMVHDFRDEVEVPDLAFVFATLGENPNPPPTAAQYGQWAYIREQGLTLGDGLGKAARVSGWGCGPYIEAKPYCHLPQSGLLILRDRFIHWTKTVVPVGV